MSSRKVLLWSFQAPLLAFLVTTKSICPSPAPPGTDFQNSLRFSGVSCAESKADVGDAIEISWTYSHEELLDSQSVILRSMTFNDVIPQELDENVNARAFTLNFATPVTVTLQAKEKSGIITSVSFDILLKENAFFKVEANAETNSNLPLATSKTFPRLGYRDDGSTTINFSQFVAFFDPIGNQNGVVDEFAQFPTFFPTDQTFRATSLSPSENDNFKFTQGSAYRPLNLNAPQGDTSNVCVYGGAIAYSGKPFDIKSDSGQFEGREDAVDFEPIFACIHFHVSFVVKSNVDLVDFELGNVFQGLVLTSALDAPGDANRGLFGTQTATFSGGGTTAGLATGSLKSVRVGNFITKANGDPVLPSVFISTAAWNMPFLPDNDLGGRLTMLGDVVD